MWWSVAWSQVLCFVLLLLLNSTLRKSVSSMYRMLLLSLFFFQSRLGEISYFWEIKRNTSDWTVVDSLCTFPVDKKALATCSWQLQTETDSIMRAQRDVGQQLLDRAQPIRQLIFCKEPSLTKCQRRFHFKSFVYLHVQIMKIHQFPNILRWILDPCCLKWL